MKNAPPKPPRLWTPDRKRMLISRYPRESAATLAAELNTTPAAVRQAAHIHGVKKCR
jgi:hypothetical protein